MGVILCPLWRNDYFSKMDGGNTLAIVEEWVFLEDVTPVPQYTTQFLQTDVDERKLTKTKMLKNGKLLSLS